MAPPLFSPQKSGSFEVLTEEHGKFNNIEFPQRLKDKQSNFSFGTIAVDTIIRNRSKQHQIELLFVADVAFHPR